MFSFRSIYKHTVKRLLTNTILYYIIVHTLGTVCNTTSKRIPYLFEVLFTGLWVSHAQSEVSVWFDTQKNRQKRKTITLCTEKKKKNSFRINSQSLKSLQHKNITRKLRKNEQGATNDRIRAFLWEPPWLSSWQRYY